jgi:hypothetical protein
LKPSSPWYLANYANAFNWANSTIPAGLATPGRGRIFSINIFYTLIFVA